MKKFIQAVCNFFEELPGAVWSLFASDEPTETQGVVSTVVVVAGFAALVALVAIGLS